MLISTHSKTTPYCCRFIARSRIVVRGSVVLTVMRTPSHAARRRLFGQAMMPDKARQRDKVEERCREPGRSDRLRRPDHDEIRRPWREGDVPCRRPLEELLAGRRTRGDDPRRA